MRLSDRIFLCIHQFCVFGNPNNVLQGRYSGVGLIKIKSITSIIQEFLLNVWFEQEAIH